MDWNHETNTTTSQPEPLIVIQDDENRDPETDNHRSEDTERNNITSHSAARSLGVQMPEADDNESYDSDDDSDQSVEIFTSPPPRNYRRGVSWPADPSDDSAFSAQPNSQFSPEDAEAISSYYRQMRPLASVIAPGLAREITHHNRPMFVPSYNDGNAPGGNQRVEVLQYWEIEGAQLRWPRCCEGCCPPPEEREEKAQVSNFDPFHQSTEDGDEVCYGPCCQEGLLDK
ncbi:MAG: hypothetical protein Q9162_001772 [Coniocarpon cinnabarinum]